jgi:hypothetical protein
LGPIEPAAITAATLLASRALDSFGGKAGESIWAGMARLARVVTRKVRGHPDVAAALDKLVAEPTDPDRIRDLGRGLARLAADDPVFGRELARLIADAKGDPVIGSFATYVDGLA